MITTRKKNKGINVKTERLPEWMRQKEWHGRAVILGVFALGLFMLFFLSGGGGEVGYDVGDIAGHKIRAPRAYSVLDEYKTEQRIRKALSETPVIYKLDYHRGDKVVKRINSFFDTLDKAKNKQEEKWSKRIWEQYQLSLDDLEWKWLTEKRKPDFQDKCRQLTKKVMSSHVVDKDYVNYLEQSGVEVRMKGNLVSLKDKKYVEIKESDISGELRVAEKKLRIRYSGLTGQMLHKIVSHFIQPNVYYDAEETEKIQERLRRAVEPVFSEIKKGEKIVDEGERISELILSLLKGMQLQQSRASRSSYVFFLLPFLLIFILYLAFYRRDIFTSTRLLILVCLLSLAIVIVARVFYHAGTSGYWVPMAAVSMVLAIAMGAELALVLTALTSVLVGIAMMMSFKYFIVAAFGGMIAVFCVRRVTRRMDLARAGIFVAVANVVAIAGINFFENVPWRQSIEELLYGAGNGVLSAILAMVILMYFEPLFKLTTDIELVEVSDLNQPILKRLALEAVGTYHHSLMTGSLAEAAAERVGANSVLARTIAYYHDIGKIVKPLYYVENQRGGESKHEGLAPTMSALIIISHVKEGVEMAEKAKLPRAVIDGIAEHHGSTLLAPFYQKAVQETGAEDVKEENFRYPGPKPQSKEVAVVMLSDSVESAARALKEPTAGRLEDVVRRIVQARFTDGQLDECDLTLRDLNNIADVFIRSLVGIYHSRPKYQEDKEALGASILDLKNGNK